MSEFKKYSSITNSYDQKYVRFVADNMDVNSVKWQITEKLHGANFSFVVDEFSNVRPASRSGITDESFYNCFTVLNRYSEAAQKVFSRLNTESDHIVSKIQIFGELFGTGVQKGVRYGEKDFAAFDILVTSMDPNSDEWNSVYLNTDTVEKICEEFGIPHVPILENEISFTKALEYNEVFDSKVLNEPNNLAEGIVIKPVKPTFIGPTRVIFKKKHEAFKEKQTEKKTPVVQNWSDEMNAVYADMSQFNTEERIRSAISKMGEISSKDIGKLIGVVSHDLNEDFLKEYSYRSLSKNEQNVLNKAINREVATLIRSKMIDIINGDF